MGRRRKDFSLDIEIPTLELEREVKIKFEKLTSLSTWMCIGPVNLFVYDSSKKRYWESSLQDWTKACHKYADVSRFPDNKKPYFALHIDDFPSEPIRCEL